MMLYVYMEGVGGLANQSIYVHTHSPNPLISEIPDHTCLLALEEIEQHADGRPGRSSSPATAAASDGSSGGGREGEESEGVGGLGKEQEEGG